MMDEMKHPCPRLILLGSWLSMNYLVCRLVILWEVEITIRLKVRLDNRHVTMPYAIAYYLTNYYVK